MERMNKLSKILLSAVLAISRGFSIVDVNGEAMILGIASEEEVVQ